MPRKEVPGVSVRVGKCHRHNNGPMSRFEAVRRCKRRVGPSFRTLCSLLLILSAAMLAVIATVSASAAACNLSKCWKPTTVDCTAAKEYVVCLVGAGCSTSEGERIIWQAFKETLCSDAVSSCESVFYFVGGFHHSGTTATQHELLRQTTGHNATARDPEKFPKGCPAPRSVWKHPTNTVDMVLKMLKLRATYPQVRLIFLRRDVPNTLWSLYKREKNTLNQTLLTDKMKLWMSEHRSVLCNTRAAWEQHPSTTLDFTVDLHNFTEHTNAIVADILGPTRRRRQLMPISTNHNSRRKWQATHSVYSDDPDLFRKETSQVVSRWLATLSCTH